MKIFTTLVIYGFFCSMLASCTRTIYNVEHTQKNKCDTTQGKLFLRIINEGKVGISSLSFNSDSGQIKYGGIMPHDTTCYFPIFPVYRSPSYKIYILRFNNFGKANGITIMGIPIDHVGDKFISGFCTMHVLLKRKHQNIKVEEFRVSKD